MVSWLVAYMACQGSGLIRPAAVIEWQLRSVLSQTKLSFSNPKGALFFLRQQSEELSCAWVISLESLIHALWY